MQSAPFDTDALVARLEGLADAPYRAFTDGLVPGAEQALGVRVPKLRAVAKELLAGDRVNLIEPADYSEGSGLELAVKDMMRKMAAADALYRRTREQLGKIRDE